MEGENIKKVQNISLKLLQEFIEVCNKMNLRYFVVGGTLLGAVRHKGFIPWDDDIDIGMPRKDYEIFVESAQKYLSPNVFLQSRLSEKKSPFLFSKLRDSNTTFIENGIKHCEINHGVYVDIFPIDGLNKDKLFKYKKAIFKRKISLLYKSKSKKIGIIKKVFKLIPFSFNFCFKNINQLYSKYDFDTSNIVVNYCGAWGDREIMKKEWIEPLIDLDFEGIKVKAPNNYQEYLTHMYGNYMELPPIEKRVSHHGICTIDLEKSYKYYLGEKK